MWRVTVAALSVLAVPVANADPRADYLLHCGGCHLPNADGAPPAVPTLHKEMGVIAAVPGGREYLVQVPGAAQSQIDDAGLAGIINWLLSEYSADTLPDNFQPLTEKEVGKFRRQILSDPLKRRAEIWPDYL